jgi:hypothetical protein
MADDRPGRSLAQRFRRAHADRQAARDAEVRNQEQLDAEAREAAAALLVELTQICRDLGFVSLRAAKEGLLLAHAGRELAVRVGDTPGQLEVAGSGGEQAAFLGRLYREAAIGAKWVLAFQHRRQEVRLPFFDAGLEELLVQGLGLERPE